MSEKQWTHPQKTFNEEDYGFDVYWFTYFTWVYSSGGEKDFKTVVRAPSGAKAKNLLVDKVKREHSGNKVKSLKTYKIHSKYRIDPESKSSSITPAQWEAFRNISFPNVTDHLHLIEKPRVEGQPNFFNRNFTPEQLKAFKKVGFKKGAKNWNKLNPITDADRPPPSERHLYRQAPGRSGASWELIPSEVRRAEKVEIVNALRETRGNRSAAARLLCIDKKELYRRMFRKHPEVDWNKEYPIGGRPKHSAAQIAKQKETYQKNKPNRVHWAAGKKMDPKSIKKTQATWKKKEEKRLAKMKPKIIQALLLHNNVRARVAEHLGISRHCLWQTMKKITDVDWHSEYPTKSDFANEFWKNGGDKTKGP